MLPDEQRCCNNIFGNGIFAQASLATYWSLRFRTVQSIDGTSSPTRTSKSDRADASYLGELAILRQTLLCSLDMISRALREKLDPI